MNLIIPLFYLYLSLLYRHLFNGIALSLHRYFNNMFA